MIPNAQIFISEITLIRANYTSICVAPRIYNFVMVNNVKTSKSIPEVKRWQFVAKVFHEDDEEASEAGVDMHGDSLNRFQFRFYQRILNLKYFYD